MKAAPHWILERLNVSVLTVHFIVKPVLPRVIIVWINQNFDELIGEYKCVGYMYAPEQTDFCSGKDNFSIFSIITALDV